MHIARTTLDPAPAGRTTLASDGARVQDKLWAHTPAGSGLEHVTVVPVTGGIHVVLFLNARVKDPASRAESILGPLAREWTPRR